MLVRGVDWIQALLGLPHTLITLSLQKAIAQRPMDRPESQLVCLTLWLGSEKQDQHPLLKASGYC